MPDIPAGIGRGRNLTRVDVHRRQHSAGWRAYLHVPRKGRERSVVYRRNLGAGRIVRDALAVHDECDGDRVVPPLHALSIMATSTPRTNRIDRALMTNLLRSLRLTGREDTTRPMVQRPDRPETGTQERLAASARGATSSGSTVAA